MKKNRREFLKDSLLAFPGTAILTPLIFSPGKRKFLFNNICGMPERTLGKTDLQLPVISMGTGDTDNPRLVQEAMNSGIRFFATSSYYGNGNNEKMLGKVFQSVRRDSYLIATSATPLGINHQDGLFVNPEAGKQYSKDIDDSLIRLGLDYVDIVFLGFAAKRESVFFEPLLSAMQDLRKKGKTRYLGIATHSFCDEALQAAADTGVYDLAMTAYNFMDKNNTKLNDAIAYAAGKGLGIVAMKTSAGAFWDKERKMPINTHAAIKWVLNNQNITSVVSGMTSFDELKGNLTIPDNLNLSEQELRDLKFASGNNYPGLYCDQCHGCISQCKFHADIPSYMRSYMYAFGYGNPAKARKLLELSGPPDIPCVTCPECNVNCSMGFDVAGKMKELTSVTNIYPS